LESIYEYNNGIRAVLHITGLFTLRRSSGSGFRSPKHKGDEHKGDVEHKGENTKGTYSFVFYSSVANGNSARNRGVASSALTGNTKEYVPFVLPFVLHYLDKKLESAIIRTQS
jgi:ABC-type phosphate transport system substrate-binding protein